MMKNLNQDLEKKGTEEVTAREREVYELREECSRLTHELIEERSRCKQLAEDVNSLRIFIYLIE